MAKRFHVPEQSVAQLERDLNCLQFEGIPIGGLLASTLIIELLNGNRDWGYKIRLKDVIASFNLRFRSNRSYFSSTGNRKFIKQMGLGKGLFTFISKRPHLFQINKPIWDLVAEDQKVGLIYHQSIRQGFSIEHKDKLMTPSDLLPVDFKHWRAAFKLVRPKLIFLLKRFASNNQLPFAVVRRLENRLMQQSQALISYQNSLKVLRPSYVVTEWDRHSLTSPLILTARDLGIPSFTMTHGVVNKGFGYLPLLADKLLCWGKRQKTLLNRYAKNPNDIVVIGAPQLSKTVLGDRREIRERLILGENDKVVVLATNPMITAQSKSLLNIFCKALTSIKALKGIVRMHPSETKDLYEKYAKKYPEIIFNIDGGLNYDETLAVADLVCIYNSAFGLDALLKDIPLVVINVDPNDLGQGEDFISIGGFEQIESSDHLTEYLDLWCKEPELRKDLKNKARHYLNVYCAAFETEAAERALDYIKATIPRQ